MGGGARIVPNSTNSLLTCRYRSFLHFVPNVLHLVHLKIKHVLLLQEELHVLITEKAEKECVRMNSSHREDERACDGSGVWAVVLDGADGIERSLPLQRPESTCTKGKACLLTQERPTRHTRPIASSTCTCEQASADLPPL